MSFLHSCRIPELCVRPRNLSACCPSGIRLYKLWCPRHRGEQLRRFKSREHDPLNRKLSPMDPGASQTCGRNIPAPRKMMYFYTHTADCPLTVIKSDDKQRPASTPCASSQVSLPKP